MPDNNREERQVKIKEIEKNQISKLKAGSNNMSRKLATFWKTQIEAVDEGQSGWIKRGDIIVKRYRNVRDRVDNEGARRMSVLWTNVQIMMPAIYSHPPIPVVDRKFLDRDVTGRLSSQILERSLKNEQEPSDYHDSIKRAVLDYLLPGRGQCWVRYEPEFGEGPSLPSESTTSVDDDLDEILDDEEGGNFDKKDPDERLDDEETEQLDDSVDQVIEEKAPVDYVDWHDFYQFPAKARTWREVQAIGKRVYMSKHEAVEFFGEEIGNQLQRDKSPFNEYNTSPYSDTSVLQDINDRNIVIFEIWNKTDRRVYWICTGYDYLCKVEDDPLKLEGFFPTPQPLNTTFTNDTIQPVADYIEWQDQAVQIDELTQRIAMLNKACKVAGTYDAANGALKRLLNETVENELIPVDSWAAFGEQNGVPGSISFLPIDTIITVIETLTKVRQQVKQDLDEVTGLNDVVRGTTDSRETLGGIRLKNNNAGTRLEYRQGEVARFARDVMRIQAQIIAKHFSEETLIESSGIMFEDELQPENVLAEVMQSDDFQKFMQMMQQQQQQQMQMMQQQQQQQQLPPQGNPQAGGNVVPFNPQQSSQTPPPSPQPPMQPPQPITPEMAAEHIKPMIPDMIKKRVQASIDILRKDVPRRYRIDIETDSTIFADSQEEKENATEFVNSFTKFMGIAEQITASLPELMPVMGKMLQWSVRKFRTGRDLESSIDTFVKQMEKKSKQLLENPPPNPDQQKAQLDMAKVKQQMDAQAQNDQRDFQRQQADDQRQAQLQATEDQRNNQLDQAKTQRELQKMGFDMELDKARFTMEIKKLDAENQFKSEEHSRQMEVLDKKEEVDDKKHKQAMAKASQKPKAPKKKASK